MKTSESIKNLTKALLIAQAKMGGATKGSKNPFFKSSYADLPTVMEVVKDPLNEAGIIVLQPPAHREGRNFIETMLIHAESGEFMQSETEVICAKQNDPQAFGAAQTYARRFGLQAMGFIPALDDDGNQAAGRAAAKVEKAVSSVYPKPLRTEELPGQNPAIVALVQASEKLMVNTNTETVTTLEPLKKSNFRKTKTEATPVVTQQQQTAPVGDSWT